jgi:uncharacterized membrane protein YdjX (TVP38/TMEM64 family)
VARLLAVFIGLAGLVLIPFAIWGGELERALSPETAAAWLYGYGAWAWAVGLGLLLVDLILPIPATAVMSALGFIYGPLLGGLVGSAGSMLAGALGYGLCRAAGPRAARRLLGEHGLEQGRRLASGTGPWLVVLSRWLPVFPEVVACMAGLTRMPAPAFLMALACGSIPLSFAFCPRPCRPRSSRPSAGGERSCTAGPVARGQAAHRGDAQAVPTRQGIRTQ